MVRVSVVALRSEFESRRRHSPNVRRLGPEISVAAVPDRRRGQVCHAGHLAELGARILDEPPGWIQLPDYPSGLLDELAAHSGFLRLGLMVVGPMGSYAH